MLVPPVGDDDLLKAEVMMATFALIHGGGDVGWYWHLVERELRQRGHDTVAPGLPYEDDAAGLPDYADVVIDAIGTGARWPWWRSHSAASPRRLCIATVNGVARHRAGPPHKRSAPQPSLRPGQTGKPLGCGARFAGRGG